MLDIKRLNNKVRHIQEENCVTDGLLQPFKPAKDIVPTPCNNIYIHYILDQDINNRS